MRILFVTAAFLPESIGGVELHVQGLARAFSEEHEVQVFCRGSDGSRPEFDLDQYEVQGTQVTRLNYLFSDCDSFEKIYRNPEIRKRFDTVLAGFEPDVVHVHHLTCLSTDLVDAAQERGIPVVMTLHDFWMGCPRGQRMTPEQTLCEEIVLTRCASCLSKMWSGWFGQDPGDDGVTGTKDLEQLERYHEWIRGLLLRVDRLVTPSESSRDVFARYGIAEEKITVVENGLDQDWSVDGHRAEDGRFHFGFVGTVIPTKGVHVLIEAFAKLEGDDSSLEIHGEALPWHEIDDYGRSLEELAAPLGDRVSFHGRYESSDLPSILGSIDTLVVPSIWYEAFCLTLREGFLAGVPVIASRLGAMQEGIEDGVTGLLFDPGDADDLAVKMKQLKDDSGLRQRLGSSPKGVRTVGENSEDLLAIYRDAIEKGAP